MACGGGGETNSDSAISDIEDNDDDVPTEPAPTPGPIIDVNKSPHACLQGTWKATSQIINGNQVDLLPVYMVVSGLTPDDNNGTGTHYLYEGGEVRIFQMTGGQIQDTYTNNWDVLISTHNDTGASDGLFTIHDACSTVYSGSVPRDIFPNCSQDAFTNTSDVTIDCNTSPANMTLTSPIASVNYLRINTSTNLNQPSLLETLISNTPPINVDALNAVPEAEGFSGEDVPRELQEPYISDAPWILDNTQSAQGNASLRSGNLEEYESSQTQAANYYQAGEVSFWYKTEGTYSSGLQFLVDTKEQFYQGGNQQWQYFSKQVEAGYHNFHWSYSPSENSDSGQHAWIDNVSLPPIDPFITHDPNFPAVNNSITPKRISAGYNHYHGVKGDGTLWSWGLNRQGVIADGTDSEGVVVTFPTQINLSNVVSVFSQSYYSMALLADGTVWSWGLNSRGQLGNNDPGFSVYGHDDKPDAASYHSIIPVQVTGLNNVVQIAMGDYHALALKNDGTVWSWGDNFNKQLGHPEIPARSSAQQVHGLSNIIQIAAGFLSSMAVRSDGKVLSWGNGSFSGTNLFGDDSIRISPDPIVNPHIDNVVAIAHSDSHVLALKSDGTVWSWGVNAHGALGNNSTENSIEPVQAHGLADVIQVSTKNYTSMALKSDGTVWIWGVDQSGKLCSESTGDKHIPTQTPLANIVEISAGTSGVLARNSNGNILACGKNSDGYLGLGLPEFGASYTANIPEFVVGESGSGIFNLGDGSSTPQNPAPPSTDGQILTPNNSDSPWGKDSATQLDGNNSFSTGDINDNQSSIMNYTTTFSAGQLSFSYKVSSEQDWDYFYFYVDGNQVLEISGDVDWTLFTTTLSAGQHTLSWAYVKDSLKSEGQDKVWVANLTLPDGTILNPNLLNEEDPAPEPDPAPEVITVTGTLNLVIEGLKYQTRLSSGTVVAQGATDALGNYEYVEGEPVEFYIGESLIHTLTDASDEQFIDITLLPGWVTDIQEIFIANYNTQILNDHTRLLNTVRLLFTLDEDQTPSNGVQIASIVHDVFSSSSFTSELKPKKFAAMAGSFLESYNRMLLEQTLTLHHLYKYFSLTLYSDENVQFTNSILLSHTIDGSAAISDSADGIADTTTTYEYDEFDRLIYDPTEGANDGFRYTYNAAGYLIERSPETPADNTSKYITTYYASGFMKTSQLYDKNDLLQGESTTYYDSNGYPTINVSEGGSITYTYDSKGNQLTHVSSGDGASVTLVWEYDESNNKTLHELTHSSGYHVLYLWEYDANKNITREFEDRNNAAIVEYTYVYDENNLLINRSDHSVTGSFTILSSTDYFYDVSGWLIRTEYDYLLTTTGQVLDGIPETITIFENDVNGNVTSSYEQGNAATAISEYDALSRLIKTTTVSTGGELIYEYAEFEGAIKSIQDIAADDIPEVITIWDLQPSDWPAPSP